MKNYIKNYIEIIEHKLNEYLEGQYHIEIWQSMRYSVMAGGKRLRPMLVLDAFLLYVSDFQISCSA